MMRSWTFGKKIGAGFAVAVAFLLIIGLIALRGADSLLKNHHWVLHSHKVTSDISQVLWLLKDLESGQRGFVITGDDRFLTADEGSRANLPKTLANLRKLLSDSPEQLARLDRLQPLVELRVEQLGSLVQLRRTAGFEAAQREVASLKGLTTMEQIRSLLTEMQAEETHLLGLREASSQRSIDMVEGTTLGGTLLAFISMTALGIFLTRSLSSQIGLAVANLQSSSTELRAAANQQASASTEQATSMNELATTMQEILASSRHITENAQRVARIADDTSRAARSGDDAVAQAHASMEIIRRQVDLIVSHMLALGKKSQQIGGILDIIKELAEQTNILAINATIESAAAGESGKRFAAVADEIRKLADRVTGSTREIRPLIDEIRAAANTTVMATEEGSKTVDAGSRQFDELATAFAQIVDLVAATAEAAREIELGTKQQTTAIEQVNLAISDVAQAAKETEVSSSQTLQTSIQLTVVSRELAHIVQRASTT
ncbi:CHASE3 domain-containing protein [bacterium]|nr:CHASE3 domain-containing protein [bacterium]